jgi:putative PIN family toxin of toxin-antitoxin system
MNPGNSMRINKFVLDNNIWVSYLITRKEQKLIDIISDNDLTVFSCDELLEEVERVLGYSHLKKYKIDIPYALKTVRGATTHYVLEYPIKRYIPTDANDDYVIALALQTNSGFVTSGDSDILDAKEILEKRFTKLTILTKAEFEKRFA